MRRLRPALPLAAVLAASSAGCADGLRSTAPAPATDTSATYTAAASASAAPASSASASSVAPPITRSPAVTPSATASSTTASIEGIDVSAYQPTVDWPRWATSGVAFAFVKATEGTTWTNRYFTAQRDGARAVGMSTGAYHYARPANSSGAAQARHFVANGGGWSDDGRTLPGALDLERNPSDPDRPCYGKTPPQMVAWIRDFTTTYRDLSGRDAVVYVKTDWWRECAGDDTSFAANPLWLFDHDAPMGPLPAGWDRPMLWQYGVETVDRNVFLGSQDDLDRWAAG